MKRIFLLTLISVFLFSSVILASEEVGKIVSKQGRVDIFKDNSQSAIPARNDDPVSIGDSIRTKSGSKAQVLFRDKSVLKLAQNSKVLIKDYQLDDKDRRKSAVIELSRGKARAIIAKTPSGAGFVITTPNAQGSVKGSDITAFYQAGNSGMFVSEGKLSVINLAHPKSSIVVPKGNACVIPMDELPKGPRPYLDVEKKLNDEDTDVPVSISRLGKVSVIKGAVAKISGIVNITPKGADTPRRASINDILGEGDRVETGENGYIEIRLDNNNAINLKPNTKLTIIRLIINPETGEFENIFEVTMGKIKARIENLKGNSKFEVKTPQAICGARGTIMYMDVMQNITKSFFEGGNGYIENVLSGQSQNIGAGENASANDGGGVSNPTYTSEDERQSYADGWDPASGTEGYSSPEGNTGADMTEFGAGISGAGGLDADTQDFTGPFSNVQFTETNPQTNGSSSSTTSPSITEEIVNFMGYFGYVAENSENPENPEVVTPNPLDSVTGQFSFTLPTSQDWTAQATYGSDNDWVAVSNNSGILGTSNNSSDNKLWIVPDAGDNNGQMQITTSDGGAIRAWMGGRIVHNGLSNGLAGKIFGIYVDPSGNGGTFYSYFEGIVDSEGNFTGSNMESHFTRRAWASGQDPVSASELFNAETEPNDIIEGKGYGSFINEGGDPTGTIKCTRLSGRSLGLYGQGWGVWRIQLMGRYTGMGDSNEWRVMLGGSSPGNIEGEPSYWFGKAHDKQYGKWQSNTLNTSFNGYYFSVNTTEMGTKIKAGIIEEGDIWGNYVETGSSNHGGTWEALGGGEWYDVTDLLDPEMLGLGINLSTLHNFVNMPITEAHSNIMNNIGAGSSANFITAQMSPAFYQSGPSPHQTNIWVGQIIGTYTDNPGSSWILNLTGNPNTTDTVTLMGDRWSDGKWHANVVNGMSGSPTPEVNISYSGDAGGTYDEANNTFFGVGAGTWQDNT